MKILLIDGNNIAWTAHWAYRDLSARDGTPTNVIYGGLSIIRNVLKETNPDQAYMFWDTGRAQFRKALYPEYKKGRHENMTEEEYAAFKAQVNKLKEMLKSLAVIQVEYKEEPTETDDLITLATQLFKTTPNDPIYNYNEIVICSTDKDFYQLVSPTVSIYNMKAKEDSRYVTCDNIEAISGYRYANEFIMFKCLSGDKSDKIKGVGSIGEVRAKKLIASVDGNKDALLVSLDSEEKVNIYRRNEKLMSLDYGVQQLSPGAIDSATSQILETYPEYKAQGVKAHLAKLDMLSMVIGFNEWVQPFTELNQRKFQKV